MFSCDCVGRDIGRIVSTTTKAKAHQNVTAAAPCTLTGLLAGIIIAIVLNVQRFQYLTSRALLSKQLLSTFSYQGGHTSSMHAARLSEACKKPALG